MGILCKCCQLAEGVVKCSINNFFNAVVFIDSFVENLINESVDADA